MSDLPETRFTRVDDLDIAYQVIGPPAGLDLVFVPGWVSHLEVMWEHRLKGVPDQWQLYAVEHT